MKKYSLDLRHEAVKAYLAGNQGYRAVANQFGVGRSVLRRWVATYKIHVLDNQKRNYQFYPIDLRARAVLSVVNGRMTVNEALAHYNIPANTSLPTWIRFYNTGGVDALQNNPLGRPKMSKKSKPKSMPEKPLEAMTREELLKELEHRRTEVAYLKNEGLGSIQTISNKAKTLIISELRPSFRMKWLLSVTGLPLTFITTGGVLYRAVQQEKRSWLLSQKVTRTSQTFCRVSPAGCSTSRGRDKQF